MLRVNQLSGFGGGAGGAVPAYVTTTMYSDVTSVSTMSPSHTKNSTTNAIVLFIMVREDAGARTVSSLTYGGVAMTLITGPITGSGSPGNLFRIWAYYINSPASGAQTLALTLSGAANLIVLQAVELTENIVPANAGNDITNTFSVTITPTPTTGVFLWASDTNDSGAIAGQTLITSGTVDDGDPCAPKQLYYGVARATNAGSALTATLTSANGGALIGFVCGPA